MPDLTTVEGVLQYLSTTPFAALSVIPLSGGSANFTYRIILREPYAAVSSDTPIRTLVLKHAESYLPGNKNFLIAVERQDFESLAFKHIPQFISPSPIVSLPKPYYEDPDRRVILMSDSGETSVTLKALLQSTPPTHEISLTIGHSLGAFLARLHSSTSAPASQGREVKAAFASNKQGRLLSSFVTYGRLIDTVTPQAQSPTLIDPPLDLSSSQLNTIAILVKMMQDRVMTSEDVLTMGDFWTGNFLVSLAPSLRVEVVDWELAKPGIAGLDIGQCLAELHLLRAFHPSSRASVDAIVASFLQAYREVYCEIAPEQKMQDIARDAVTHLGAHLAVWTPRVPWGSKEQTRAVVLEGVEYLLQAVDGDDVWLRTSIVGPLTLDA